MTDLRTRTNNIMVVVVPILFVLLYLNGCVHSCRKHKDDPGWLQDSPAAIYRGLEFFWHKDYAGIDWNEKVKNDAATALDLIAASKDVDKIVEINEQIDEFSETINDYPQERINEIKAAVKCFIRFAVNSMENVYNYVTGKDSVVSMSTTAKISYDSLVGYYKYVSAEELKRSFDSVAIVLRKEQSPEIIKSLEYKKNLKESVYAQPYYRIFKEKLVL